MRERAKGLQTGPDLILAVVGGIVVPALVVAMLATAARAGVQDGPDGVDPMGVTADGGEALKAAEFAVGLPGTGAEVNTYGVSCGMREIDYCWNRCEDERDARYPGYTLNRVECRGGSSGPSCRCIFTIPGPYVPPPDYWPISY